MSNTPDAITDDDMVALISSAIEQVEATKLYAEALIHLAETVGNDSMAKAIGESLLEGRQMLVVLKRLQELLDYAVDTTAYSEYEDSRLYGSTYSTPGLEKPMVGLSSVLGPQEDETPDTPEEPPAAPLTDFFGNPLG